MFDKIKVRKMGSYERTLDDLKNVLVMDKPCDYTPEEWQDYPLEAKEAYYDGYYYRCRGSWTKVNQYVKEHGFPSVSDKETGKEKQ